jgi:hypothetical protein
MNNGIRLNKKHKEVKCRERAMKSRRRELSKRTVSGSTEDNMT